MLKINDFHLNSLFFSPVCSKCLNFKITSGAKKTCAAFSDGIPSEIWLGKNDHTKTYPGDKGITYKSIIVHPAFNDGDF